MFKKKPGKNSLNLECIAPYMTAVKLISAAAAKVEAWKV